MSEKTVLKQFFQFAKQLFPPASAPFRRGMAIGIAIGVATMVVLFVAFIVAMSGMGGMPAMIAFSVAFVATEPWSRFLPGTFFNFFRRDFH